MGRIAELQSPLLQYPELPSAPTFPPTLPPHHPQDPTLDFEPRPYPVEAPGVTFQHRMLQLKVRVKAIIHSLKAADRPPDNLLDFFVTLFEDDNYFGERYLWPCEAAQLVFNDDAGTRNMIIATGGDGFEAATDGSDNEDDSTLTPLAPSFASSNAPSFEPSNALGKLVAGFTKPPTNPKNLVTLTSRPGVEFDIGRARMMLQNFLLVRMLVGHVVLTPWTCSACRRPSKKPRVINNYRIVATLFYEMIAQNDSLCQLPKIGSLQVSRMVTKGEHDE